MALLAETCWQKDKVVVILQPVCNLLAFGDSLVTSVSGGHTLSNKCSVLDIKSSMLPGLKWIGLWKI
jgi:hypothetical protein